MAQLSTRTLTILLISQVCLSPTSSSTLDGFTTIILGRSANAIELLVPTAFRSRQRSFESSNLQLPLRPLFEHGPNYTFAELIATFNHIPGNTYNAVLESAITIDDSSEN
jgi:hypothetical protein